MALGPFLVDSTNEEFRKDSEHVDEELRLFFPDLNYVGTFVDVGACHPEWLSNSFHFEQSGWLVVCVEPNPAYVELLKKDRKHVLPYAAYYRNQAAELLIHDCKIGPLGAAGYTTLNQTYRGTRSRIKERVIVEAKTLNWMLSTHFPQIHDIDIVSIDVEGGEHDVLDGFDVGRYLPKIFVIEHTGGDSCWAKLMPHGYVQHKPKEKRGPNEFFVISWLYDTIIGRK